MIRRPPRSTRTDTLFPYTTLFRSDLADLEIEQEGFEFRHRRAAGDLAEIAAFLPRTAVRELPCHVGEGLRALQNPRQCRLRSRLGLRRRIRIGRIGGEEDVRALIKILAAEALKVVLVVSPAGRLVGLG